MRSLVCLTFFVSMMVTTTTLAELTPAARLRKMSIRVRGIAPTSEEFQELSQLRNHQSFETYFVQKAKEYADSDWSELKLTERFIEDFRLQQTGREQREMREDAEKGVPGLRPPVFSYRERLAQNLRSQIRAGATVYEILGNESLYRQFADELALAYLSQFRTRRNVLQFATVASGLGYNMRTVEGARDAIEAFRADPIRFNGKIWIPLTKNEALKWLHDFYKRMIILPQNANVDRGEFDAWLGLLRDLQKYPVVRGHDAFVWMRDARSPGAGEYAGFVDPRRAQKRFITIPRDEVLNFNCALQVVNDEYGNGYACPATTPFVDGLESDLELAARAHSGFFFSDGEAAAMRKLKAAYPNGLSLSQQAVNEDSERMRQTPISIFGFWDVAQRFRGTQYSLSAAFFRIHLCDEMTLVTSIDNSKKTQKALEKLNFSGSPELVGKPNEKPQDKQHIRSECMACHRKLDMPQELFDQTKGGEAVTGERTFVYDDFEGVEHRIPMHSSKDFYKLVQQQPQFVRCQSEKFWSWIIGDDVSLNQKRRAELMEKFKSLNGSPKELVAYLAMRPEFYDEAALGDAADFSIARKTLQRCNTCHQGEGTLPSFTKFPIVLNPNQSAEAKQAEHVRYLADIAKQLDIFGDGAAAKMPPEKSGWVLSDSQRFEIAQWIWGGAPDDSGRSTVSAAERDVLFRSASTELKARLVRSREAVATFRPTWRRFFENFDFLKILRGSIRHRECYEAAVASLPSLGGKSTITGRPEFDRPSAAFRKSYGRCIEESGLKVVGLGEARLKELAALKTWSAVSPELRGQVQDEQIAFHIGKGVLRPDQAERLKKRMSIASDQQAQDEEPDNALKRVLQGARYLLNSDDFLVH